MEFALKSHWQASGTLGTFDPVESLELLFLLFHFRHPQNPPLFQIQGYKESRSEGASRKGCPLLAQGMYEAKVGRLQPYDARRRMEMSDGAGKGEQRRR